MHFLLFAGVLQKEAYTDTFFFSHPNKLEPYVCLSGFTIGSFSFDVWVRLHVHGINVYSPLAISRLRGSGVYPRCHESSADHHTAARYHPAAPSQPSYRKSTSVHLFFPNHTLLFLIPNILYKVVVMSPGRGRRNRPYGLEHLCQCAGTFYGCTE